MKPNKRILPLIAAVVCMPISVYAHGLGKAGLINADWTPIQVGAWPFSVFSAETKVYGVNFDLLGAYPCLCDGVAYRAAGLIGLRRG